MASGGADNRERDGTGEGDAIPHQTAARRPPRHLHQDYSGKQLPRWAL